VSISGGFSLIKNKCDIGNIDISTCRVERNACVIHQCRTRDPENRFGNNALLMLVVWDNIVSMLHVFLMIPYKGLYKCLPYTTPDSLTL
jgi:hypothetical protein